MKAADPLPALSESGGTGFTQSEENSAYCLSDNYGPAAVVLDALGRAAKRVRVSPPLQNGQQDIRPSRSQVRASLHGIYTALMFQLCHEHAKAAGYHVHRRECLTSSMKTSDKTI